MKKFQIIFGILILGLGVAGVIFQFYSFIFARTVSGNIVGVEHVVQNNTIVSSTNPQVFSFAIAIKDAKTGEIVTGSSEDRQWAVARQGHCAEAKFFPYPPWNLSRAGTYFGVRLIRLEDCPGGNKPVDAMPKEDAATRPINPVRPDTPSAFTH